MRCVERFGTTKHRVRDVAYIRRITVEILNTTQMRLAKAGCLYVALLEYGAALGRRLVDTLAQNEWAGTVAGRVASSIAARHRGSAFVKSLPRVYISFEISASKILCLNKG